MKKIKFFLLALPVMAGVAGALAFKASRSSSAFSGGYRLTTTESWVSQGTPAADQNINNYQPVVGAFRCLDPKDIVCVYTVDDVTGIIYQDKPGHFVQP